MTTGTIGIGVSIEYDNSSNPPNTQTWKPELESVHGFTGNDLGLIAQEVEAVLPLAVRERWDGYKAVRYDKVIAVLVEAIKELNARIEALEG